MFATRKAGPLLLALPFAIFGDLEQATLTPPAAQAATKLVCGSGNYDFSRCDVPRGDVRLKTQLSRAPCIQDRTWGVDRRGLWVTMGCAGVFEVRSGGSDVGAAVLGGVLGAMLAGGSNGHSYSHSVTTTHVHNYYGRPVPQPYDRYGMPNYDSKGRYDGGHGIGLLVDNPDIGRHRRDTSQDVDPTVQKFDKDGNPNYDVDGNYIGAHGLGALVDNPDTANDDDDNN